MPPKKRAAPAALVRQPKRQSRFPSLIRETLYPEDLQRNVTNRKAGRPKARRRKAVRTKAAGSKVTDQTHIAQDKPIVALNANEITQQNIIQSTLLRLPAEIHNQIWTCAYSHLVIHPIRVPYSRTHEVRYATCRQSDIIQNRYTRTLKGKSLEGFDLNLGRDTVAGPRFSCDCSLYISPKKSKRTFPIHSQPKIPPAFAMPLVCKQFYYEASYVIFSTSIFSFKDSRNLVAFAVAPESPVANVQQISIEWLNTELWSATALSHDVLRRFRSLHGVHLYADLQGFYGESWVNHLKKTVSKFQRCNLHADMVSVVIRNFRNRHRLGRSPQKLTEELKRILLDTPAAPTTPPPVPIPLRTRAERLARRQEHRRE